MLNRAFLLMVGALALALGPVPAADLGPAHAHADPGPAAHPATADLPPPATHQVLVTNVVVVTVTNYVVTTNGLVGTNGLRAAAILPPTNTLTSTLPPLDWVPPRDTFDWIQLKSGEWLKGRFKGMQDRELDFESAEMDDQTFDWQDIRQVRSFRTFDVLFVDDTMLSGPVTITPSTVAVGDGEPQEVPRQNLQSLTPGGSRERDYWSGKFSLGLTLRGGNTEQTDYTAQARLERRTPATRVRLDYLGNLSSVGGVDTANSHRTTTQVNVWLSRRLYLVVPFVEYYRDPFQNLAHRVTASIGVGYDLISQPNVEWSVMAGPAYQYIWYDSTQPGVATEKGAAALVFGTGFEWDITRQVEFSLDYRGQYTSRETGETTHHGEATLSIDLTKRFDLDVSFIWDRVSNPKAGADGVQPKPDDYRMVFSVGVDF